MLKNILFALLVLLMAAASVVLSEVLLAGLWIPMAPFDVTGNLFWRALLPVQLVNVGIASLLLMRIFKANYLLYMPLYALAFCILHGLELNSFFNPPMDIARYLVAILLACGFWFTLLIRLYIRP